METNIVSRYVWFQPWHIPQQEAWLEDMAEEGLHLKEIGSVRAKFIRVQPAKQRYRIDIFNLRDPLAEERIAVYRQAGWHYAGNRWLMQFFRADCTAAVPEIHTDAQEQAYLIKQLYWQMVARAVLVVVLTFAGALILENAFRGNPMILLEDNLLLLMGMVMLYIYYCYTNVSSVRHLPRLIKTLKLNQPLARNEDYMSTSRWHRRVTLVALVTSSFLVLLPPVVRLPGLFQQRYPPFPEGPVPVVRLAEIDDMQGLTFDEYIIPGHGDIANFLVESTGIMVPQQYHSRETTTAAADEDVNGTYAPSIENRVFVTRAPLIGASLFRMLVEKEQRNLLPNSHPEILTDSFNFDAIWFLENEHRVELIALLDHKVMYVRYFGVESLEAVMLNAYENLAER